MRVGFQCTLYLLYLWVSNLEYVYYTSNNSNKNDTTYWTIQIFKETIGKRIGFQWKASFQMKCLQTMECVQKLVYDALSWFIEVFLIETFSTFKIFLWENQIYHSQYLVVHFSIILRTAICITIIQIEHLHISIVK